MPLWWRQPFSDPAEREVMIDSAVERLKPERFNERMSGYASHV